MPNLFNIQAVATRVPLDANRKGEASFAVTNISGVAVRGRVLLKADNPDVLSYLTIEGDVERDYSTGQSRQYTVKIEVPPSTAAGDYTFHLDALDVLNPDERYVEGPVVTFEVPAPIPEPPPVPWWKKIPWWVFAAIAGAILLTIVVVIVLVTRAPTPIANYPLSSNANDATGNFGPMTLENTPFIDGGIQGNGIYQGSGNPNFSHAETPPLTTLDINNFSIQATFKPAEVREMPVFMGGNSFRWIGFYLLQNGHVGLKFNNGGLLDCGDAYQVGQFQTGIVTYDGATAILYLDGDQACEQAFAINSGNDRIVSITDFSRGLTFKGILKDLKVFKEVLTP